jgi:hypothetical protein
MGATMAPMTFAPLIEFTRGGTPESMHFGVVAVVDAHGRLRAAVGDPHTRVFTRSTIKALQACRSCAAAGRRNLVSARSSWPCCAPATAASPCTWSRCRACWTRRAWACASCSAAAMCRCLWIWAWPPRPPRGTSGTTTAAASMPALWRTACSMACRWTATWTQATRCSTLPPAAAVLTRHRLLGAEAVQVVRPAGLGAGAAQAFAAKGLHAHHRADHVAVDVDIAHPRRVGNALRAAVDAGLHAQRQAVAQRVDLAHHGVRVATPAHHVQHGAEDLGCRSAMRRDLETPPAPPVRGGP